MCLVAPWQYVHVWYRWPCYCAAQF
jgi:hypothetical protein